MTAMAGTNSRGQDTLLVPASVSAGAGIDVGRYTRVNVYLKGTFTATVDIQLSDEDVDASYRTVATLSAAGLSVIAADGNFLRAKTTAYTSGTPTAVVIGSR